MVAGTQDAVLMVESEAKGLSEDVMLGAVLFGHQQMRVAIAAINKLAAEAGKPRWDWKPAEETSHSSRRSPSWLLLTHAAAYGLVVKQARCRAPRRDPAGGTGGSRPAARSRSSPRTR